MAAETSVRLSAAAAAAGLAEALALLALLAAPWPYGGAPDGARYLLAAAALAAGAAWAASRMLLGEGPGLSTAAALGLPAVALAQVALGRSVAPARTLDGLLLLTAFAAALVVFLGRTRERAAALRVAGAVIAVCVAQVLFALAQWSLGPSRLYGHVSEEVTAPFGSFVNHNHFAALVETGVLLCAGLAWGLYRRAEAATPATVALGGLGLALAAAQLASGSRGGLIALLSGAFCLVALRLFGPGRDRSPGVRTAAAVLVVAALAGALALALVSPQARTRLASLALGRADRSGAYRVDTAVATLATAAHRPLLGSGFGAFEDALPPFKRQHGDVRTTHAESDVLEVMAEGGLLGVLALAALGVVCWRALALRLRHRRERTRRWLALAAAAASAAVLTHAVLDFGLRLPAVALALAAVLGLAAAPREERGRGGAAASAALVLVFAGAAGATLGRAQAALELDRARGLADVHLRAAALADVVSAHPRLADAQRARAQVLAVLATGDGSGQRLGRAGAALGEALRGRPQWSAAWADLGWVRETAGDTDGARAAYDRAATLDPASGRIGLARAGFLMRRGDGGAAAAEVARVWSHNPGWTREEVTAAARRLSADISFLEAVSRLPGPERP